MIWRLDDDNVPEPNVLETLLSFFNHNPILGAVGGLVLFASNPTEHCSLASNKIEDIFLGLNEQWYIPEKMYDIKKVDHIYSSFLFRKEAGAHGYNMLLSKVGHREETLFTYEMKLNGWDVCITPKCKTWHYQNPSGGIREGTSSEMWAHDEMIFKNHLYDWDVKITDPFFVVLDNGLGDHFAFKNILPEIKERNKDKKIILSVCYPEVFKDEEDVQLISIGEAGMLFGESIDQFHIYKFMADRNWNTSIVDAFKEMYLHS